jgi:hypothetical protein
MSVEFVCCPDRARPGFIPGKKKSHLRGELPRDPGRALNGRLHAKNAFPINQTPPGPGLFPGDENLSGNKKGWKLVLLNGGMGNK